jgi:hypothetical protein
MSQWNANKQLTNIIIIITLSSQLLIPLSYYIRDAHPFDERFAWRMFSPIRMVECSTVWREGEDRHRVRPSDHVHIVWLNLMKRMREDVVRRYISHRCQELVEDGGDPHVYAETHCLLPNDDVVGLDREISELRRTDPSNHIEIAKKRMNAIEVSRLLKKRSTLSTLVLFSGQSDVDQNLCAVPKL